MHDERRTMNGGRETVIGESVTTATYVKVVALEAAIILLLYLFGRIYS